MPRPVCVSCGRSMERVRLGVVVEFQRKGKDKQLPYQKFSGDEYQCGNCGARVLSSFGECLPHHHPQYEAAKAEIVIPDGVFTS